MWYLLYNLLLLAASPVIMVRLLGKKRCRRGLPERLGLSGLFGLNAGDRHSKSDAPVIWLHAVSLGEVVAAVPLVRELRARHPGFRIVVSTVTETGREAVERRLGGVAEHCYAPLDFPWAVSQAVRRLKPSVFLFVEAELWPNLLRVLAQRGVPAILVNGRLSSRSFLRYRVIKPFMRQVLGKVTRCLMQSDRDVERIVALGAKPDLVVRAGNIKFDQPLPSCDGEINSLTREVLKLDEEEELVIAGSTHPGEEQELLIGYAILHRQYPSLVLLLAPRHIERAEEVERVVREFGFVPVRRSVLSHAHGKESGKGLGPRVLILDTRGELLGVYRHALVAYVGGTLVPVGGHNLLEPALWGRPVLFGPNTDHCAEVANCLIQAGGGRRVQDGKELAQAIGELLRDRVELTRMGRAAKAFVFGNRGAVVRCLEHIERLLYVSGTASLQKKRKLSTSLTAVKARPVREDMKEWG